MDYAALDYYLEWRYKRFKVCLGIFYETQFV